MFESLELDCDDDDEIYYSLYYSSIILICSDFVLDWLHCFWIELNNHKAPQNRDRLVIEIYIILQKSNKLKEVRKKPQNLGNFV